MGLYQTGLSHEHTCRRCGNHWRHGDDLRGNLSAHTCTCGNVEWYQTGKYAIGAGEPPHELKNRTWQEFVRPVLVGVVGAVIGHLVVKRLDK